jgi:hypothetical protein
MKKPMKNHFKKSGRVFVIERVRWERQVLDEMRQ